MPLAVPYAAVAGESGVTVHRSLRTRRHRVRCDRGEW